MSPNELNGNSTPYLPLNHTVGETETAYFKSELSHRIFKYY